MPALTKELMQQKLLALIYEKYLKLPSVSDNEAAFSCDTQAVSLL